MQSNIGLEYGKRRCILMVDSGLISERQMSDYTVVIAIMLRRGILFQMASLSFSVPAKFSRSTYSIDASRHLVSLKNNKNENKCPALK